jgi:hypothetical protein
MDANTNSPTLRSQTAFVDSSSAHTTKATEKGRRKSLLRTSKTTVTKHRQRHQDYRLLFPWLVTFRDDRSGPVGLGVCFLGRMENGDFTPQFQLICSECVRNTYSFLKFLNQWTMDREDCECYVP